MLRELDKSGVRVLLPENYVILSVVLELINNLSEKGT